MQKNAKKKGLFNGALYYILHLRWSPANLICLNQVKKNLNLQQGYLYNTLDRNILLALKTGWDILTALVEFVTV